MPTPDRTTIEASTRPTAVSPAATCKLSPEQLAARRTDLIPGLFGRAERVTDLPDGLRFVFENRPGLIADLAMVVEREQDCCSFLAFRLATEPNAGPVTLDVTGPAGTAEMLRKL
ncbi:MAG: uncharacterized protein JWO31_2604 [Phycisphaerales bacterium]|nr:uncharacterized protein [Phycisphaerales bacterium]